MIDGSHKGKAWYLYFIWPIVFFTILLPEILTSFNSWLLILCIIIFTVWGYATKVLIKKIKDEFN